MTPSWRRADIGFRVLSTKGGSSCQISQHIPAEKSRPRSRGVVVSNSTTWLQRILAPEFENARIARLLVAADENRAKDPWLGGLIPNPDIT